MEATGISTMAPASAFSRRSAAVSSFHITDFGIAYLTFAFGA